MANNLNYKVGLSGVQAAKGANSVRASLTTLARSTKSTSKEMSGLYSQIRKTNNQFSNMTKDSNRASLSIGKLGKSFGTLNMVMGAAKFAILGNMLKSAIDSAIDMVEVNNLFAVSLGKSADEAGRFVEEMSVAFGLDQTNIKSSIGTFALLARSMGINTGNAEILSTNMAKLALDLSSLNNVPINQVMGDLRSGLVGQSETVYKYGIDVTEASLKTEAMNQGISKSVRNMSQGEKMALRYSVMLRQSSLAHGDFARTLETPANQLKILYERVVSLSRAIGSLFMGVLGSVLPYLNAFVSLLTKAISGLAALMGFEMPKIDYSSMDNFTGSADEAVDSVSELGKKMKGITAGIDELNLLTPPSSGGSEGTGVTAGNPNDFAFGDYDNLMSKVKMKANDLEKDIAGAFSKIGDALQPIIDAIQPLAEMSWDNLQFLVDEVLVPIGEWAIQDVAPVFIDLISSALRILKEVLEELKPYLSWLWDNVLKPMGEFAGDVFLGFLKTMSDSFDKLADYLEENDDAIKSVIGGISKLAIVIGAFELMSFIGQVGSLTGAFKLLLGMSTAMTTSLWGQITAWAALSIAKLKDFGQTVALKTLYMIDFLKSIVTGTGALMVQIGQFALLTAAKVVDAIKTVALTVATNVLKVAQALLNVVMSANPIGLVIAIIAGLVTAFITAYTTSETFRDTVNEVFNTIKNTITTVVDTIKGIIGGFISKVGEAIDKFKEFLGLDGEAPTISQKTIDGRTQRSSGSKIPKLANGGMLDGGSLFAAGEFGKSELIGSYNNKTTVMPLENSDFTKSMYDAVYSAITNSMPSESGNISVVISQDEVTSSVIRGNTAMNRKLGRSALRV